MTTENKYIISEVSGSVSTVKAADKIYEMQKDFEARTNKELYDLLAGIYDLYINAVECKYVDDTIVEMKKELKKNKITVMSSTPSTTIFVRYVYRTDRKKAYKYSQVMQLAEKNKVGTDAFADFIKAKGGIEACIEENKNTGSGDKVTSITFEDRLNELNNVSTIGSLSIPSVALSDGAKYTFVLARVVENNKLDLLHVMPEASNKMLREAIKEMDKEKESNDVVEDKAEVEVTIKRPISAFNLAIESAKPLAA